MREETVVVSTEIAATPSTVYQLLTDFSRWTQFIAETRPPAVAPEAADRGATFRAWNRNGPLIWRTTSRIVVAEPGRCFAFKVTVFGRPMAVWRYDITATPHGCRVTESTRDQRARVLRTLTPLTTGVWDRQARNRRNMETTLTRLRTLAEGGAFRTGASADAS
ncbi:SRPBCC family protein [Streptomyces sp. NPDC054797]